MSMGNGGRRKKRSTIKRTLRTKRQEETAVDQEVSENITLVSKKKNVAQIA